MKNPVYILIGKTCVGKTTLEKKLQRENNYHVATSYTTRKKYS